LELTMDEGTLVPILALPAAFFSRDIALLRPCLEGAGSRLSAHGRLIYGLRTLVH